MSRRLPIVLSATALVVAALGATPAGEATANVVKRALFANNAGKVDGISASRTPRPGKLLPLDGSGKFPASALPASPPAVEPPPTAEGPLVAGDAFSAYNDAEVTVGVFGTTTATLPIPEAGAYVFVAKAVIGGGASATCYLSPMAGLVSTTDAIDTADAAPPGTVSLSAVRTYGSPGVASVVCTANSLTATVTARWTKITALRVDGLTSTPVTG